ncbi:MAG: SDR family oxidoreductase [Chloroflexi bacterium]|nr:SDR family oxidoreductase [Chloroflexota bacterium]
MKLRGSVVLVAGATRGAGRGIATELALAGATVVATGRSSRIGGASPMGRSETIEETAELIQAAGGECAARVVDHSDSGQVAGLVDWIKGEFGRLDVLVNDIWGGDPLTDWGKRFWEHSLENGLALLRTAVETHLITSWHAAPLLIENGGLIVEITDGVHDRYRENLFYDLAKHSVNRLALAQACELKAYGVAAVAVSPGFLRCGAGVDPVGVAGSDWRDARGQGPRCAYSGTPRFVGRGVAALAADPNAARFSGQALGSWDLSDEYGCTDVDGSRPHWRKNVEPVEPD